MLHDLRTLTDLRRGEWERRAVRGQLLRAARAAPGGSKRQSRRSLRFAVRPPFLRRRRPATAW